MKKILVLIGIVAVFTSCFKEPEIWNSSTVDCAGDWYVTTAIKGGDVVEAHKQIYTYNTAADDGTMFVNLTNIALIQTISKVKTHGKSFSGTDVLDIANGLVTEDGGTSKTGNVTDAIYMEVTYGGITYVIQGHRKTGFQEDEY